MELKPNLQDYTRAEFVDFINQIAAVNVPKQQHDRMVKHFDAIVGHPKGADLLFYPEPSIYDWMYSPPELVARNLKAWHNSMGRIGFKDDTLPHNTPRLGIKEQARKTSSEKLKGIQTMLSSISQFSQAAENAFNTLDGLLDSAEQLLQASAVHPASDNLYVRLNDMLEKLEAADYSLVMAVQNHAYYDSSFEFIKRDAERSVSSTHLDKDLQVHILGLLTDAGNTYLPQLSLFKKRQQAVFPRTEVLLDRLEERLVYVATAVGVGPTREASVFVAPIEGVGALPRVVTTNVEGSAAFERIAPDLKASIRSAVAGLAWMAPSADGSIAGWAKVFSFQFDKRGCGSPFAVSTPLSALAPVEGVDWGDLARQGQAVDLKFRLCSGVSGPSDLKVHWGLKDITEFAHISVAYMDGLSSSPKVKVMAAQWDSTSSAYYFVRPTFPADRFYWSGNALHKAVDTRSMSDRLNNPGYLEPVNTPVTEILTTAVDLQFDDCIVVFPQNSGIEPVYVMFKGGREYAGSASGVGRLAGSDWRKNCFDGRGAAIPSQIAGQLRDKVFKRFSLFTKAFWKAVASSSELSAQFSAEDLAVMKKGGAPIAHHGAGQLAAGTLEISHVVSPETGGGVYDMDNMRVTAHRAFGA